MIRNLLIVFLSVGTIFGVVGARITSARQAQAAMLSLPLPAATDTPAAGGTATPSGTALAAATATPTATGIAGATATGTPGCAADWQVAASPNTGPLSNYLNGVSGVAANDAWAVGYYQTDNGGGKKTLVQHWNGAQWAVVPSPNLGPDAAENQFRAVSARAPDDVWAVGDYLGGLLVSHPLVEHWDGRQWRALPSPDGESGANYLNGVSARAPDDVWAVGYAHSFTVAGLRTLTLHWNGRLWAVIPSPDAGNNNNILTAVTAVAPDDAWAVGAYLDEGTGTREALTEHWDGSTWSIVPNAPLAAASALAGVTALAPGDVWATGSFTGGAGVSQTLLEHWDGLRWKIVPSPNVGAFGNELFALTGRAAGDVWAAGHYNDPQAINYTLILHWNGSVWSVVASPSPGSLLNDLVGVSAVAADEVWVAGYLFSPGNSTQALIEHYSAACATPAPTSTPLITPTACALAFSDVPAGSAFYGPTRCLACLGILSGYADGTFRPNTNVTRAQVAKLVANAAGFTDPPGPPAFQDVPPGHPFYPYIQRLAFRGDISGYGCGGPGEPCMAPGNRPYFRPDRATTRAQLAKIVSTAAGFGGLAGFQLFADVAPDHPFYTYAQLLGARQIMDGYQCGGPDEPCIPPFPWHYFRPNANATRGQTAKIIANAFFPECSPRVR